MLLIPPHSAGITTHPEEAALRREDRPAQATKRISLIELLIVVAIMLIMATIANPNLAKARIAANESSVLGTLRTMNTAAVTYRAGYPPTFVGLAARLRVPAPRLTCSTRPSSQPRISQLQDHLPRCEPASGRGSCLCGLGQQHVCDRAVPVQLNTTGNRSAAMIPAPSKWIRRAVRLLPSTSPARMAGR